MTCSYVCGLQFLVGAVLLLGACPSIYGDLENSPELSVCLNFVGSVDVTATASWQRINALDLKAEAYRSCTINIQWQLVPTQLPVQPSPQMLLLLRIDSVQLGTSDMQCDASTSSLMLYASDSAQGSYICHMSNATYLWAASILNMYILFVPGLVSGSIAVAFKLAPATNVCNMNGSELLVDSKVYVFAPDERYAVIPPNGKGGCQAGVNHSVSIIAANSSCGLVITVLAAPSPDSCRVLCANDTCFSQTASYAAPPGALVNIVYSSRFCIGDGGAKKSFNGFTLKVESVNEPLSTEETYLAVTGYAIGGGAILVTAIVAAAILGRSRRGKCKRGRPRPHDSHLTHGSDMHTDVLRSAPLAEDPYWHLDQADARVYTDLEAWHEEIALSPESLEKEMLGPGSYASHHTPTTCVQAGIVVPASLPDENYCHLTLATERVYTKLN